VLDIGFGIIFGLIALILSPFIVLGIRLGGPGDIFYRQKRVGKDGKEFGMVKFRTMVPDAEKDGVQWAQKDDPRITKFGKFLRLTRLDELPQLINVLKGEMSFIGPRPERPEFVKTLSKEIPHYNLRHLIRPGITGWAQINYPYGSSEEDVAKKLRYDLYYLKGRSFLLDVEVVLKTISVVFSRKGR
jgi:lipopolysaccharide/colanic/teichoic acid biosynthesis glycosyltransferase